MAYKIEWTEPAAQFYRQLKQSAESCIDAGQSGHPAVLVFNEVEDALNHTLSTCPCDPTYALAGMLSIIYKLPLRSVSISYLINPSKPIVIVLTIEQRNPAIRKWLNTAIEDGAVDELLAHLGIEKPSISVDVSERWTH
jgi:mRNA-degrading endonuclease RelE of RelBE toxin-antitoxin system